ncbi:MAG: spore gernimation protein [Pelotomaculum sp.]|nr:spore gernimation protein [Pelotomaculum sp.]
MTYYRRDKRGIAGALAALLSILLLLTACNFLSRQAPEAGTAENYPPGEETVQPQFSNLAVYYVKMTGSDAYLVREVHQVPFTREVAKAALEELINTAPSTPGAVRVLPPATKIRGISIKDGLATVDFSRDVLRANTGASGEALGIQSIVNTLTEFPEVQKVSFLVEGRLDQEAMDWWGHVGLYGQPFSRDVSKVYEPSIWVTSPVPGQKVTSPIEVRGSARVFGATVNARLLDGSGRELARGTAAAAQGAPLRGDFILSLPFHAVPPGSGNLEVYWISPRDGSELDKIIVPVSW